MANNFITNSGDKTLKNRMIDIVSCSNELKFLIGFFYFNGWEEIYKTLQETPHIQFKILVGLQVEKILHQLVEHDVQQENMTQNEIVRKFFEDNKSALNHKNQDNENFYTQVEFFLKMLIENRLEIRKTKDPNHAKLYIFKYSDAFKKIGKGSFITGSSNFTQAGLSGGKLGQAEFNVEIKDYGFEDAEQYFDELWENSIKITEVPERKQILIDLIQHKTQVASVTPFEAYVLVLKTYLDLQQTKTLKPQTERILEEIGFKKFQYQLDAVNQALNIINEHNGVIIADVVGLGKSVIASLIAKNLGSRGMIICPPGLMGNPDEKTGWYGYVNDFQLYNWKVQSRGSLEKIKQDLEKNNDIDIIIVDEAHYFRNQDTTDYEYLSAICKDRKVILLTATPFNNSPADIYALLNLFIVPGKSSLTLNNDLKQQFSAYNYQYKWISEIMKNHNAKDTQKKAKAERLYQSLISEKLPIDINLVKKESKKLANKIKNVLEKVAIRRNRLDLKEDKIYSQEVGELSEMKPPQELFYYFTPEQSQFYNEVISHYFGENGRFKGAIYQPFIYEQKVEEEKLDMEGNRAFNQQKNLYDFMRRLLVKRFESSFGAFEKSVNRFLEVHQVVLNFIEKSGGKFIMDRNLIEKMMNEDFSDEAIDELLERYQQASLNKRIPKNNKVYEIKKFVRQKDFIADIEQDIKIFEEIQNKIKQFNLVEKDPKRERIVEEIEKLRTQEPDKKIIVFSEYVDTILHLKDYFRKKFKNRVLVGDGKITAQFERDLNKDFNAQYKAIQTNYFDILLTSDRLSEGYNLNRAGIIINYDIPWNPTRVIQRVGRINRIGQKVFEELSIFNFFPSEIGADIVKSREIAQQKMYLIHSSLGEDSKIFDVGEEPSASSLYSKVNTNFEGEELNFETEIRNTYQEIKEKYPEVIQKIEQLPNRIKTAKNAEKYQLNVLKKKGLGLFAQVWEDDEIKEIPFENLVENIRCDFSQEKKTLSAYFWTNYEAVKNHQPKFRNRTTAESLESKALSNLQTYIGLGDKVSEENVKFADKLIEDIKKYHSLPDRTLGRFGRKKLSSKSKESEIKAFDEEIDWIRKLLGDNYLEKLLEKVGDNEKDVIIAVENKSIDN